MGRNFLGRYLGDVAVGLVAKIVSVYLLSVRIYIGGEYAFSAERVKSQPKATDASEKIYEPRALKELVLPFDLDHVCILAWLLPR